MNQVSLQNFERMRRGRIYRYAEIFRTLYLHQRPMSAREIAVELKVGHNKISGRFSELIKKDQLYRVRHVLNPSGNPEWQVWFKWKK